MSLRPFADPSENLPADKLQGLCERGILDRYGSSGRLKQAKQRLEHELEVIAKFPDGAEYFLLLNQVIEFARGKGISATVRGSACGSIVCYILKLSNVCPLEYGLLFERFLHSTSKTVPDIDINVCLDRREEVVAFLRNKFETVLAPVAGRAMSNPFEQVLGLRALATIDRTVNRIRESHGIELDLDQLPLDDERTFALLQQGDIEGVFPVEIKPNTLVGANPQRCVTTHPSVLEAACVILQKAGCNITYGDSPRAVRWWANANPPCARLVSPTLQTGLASGAPISRTDVRLRMPARPLTSSLPLQTAFLRPVVWSVCPSSRRTGSPA